MFPLHINIDSKAIASLKAELTKSFSNVKSSHRVEALARGFGFSTYAAMLATSQRETYYPAELNWASFDAYLKSHGFCVTAYPLYLAVGRVALQQILSFEQDLTMHGIGVGNSIRDPEGNWETDDEIEKRFHISRDLFLDDRAVCQFLCAFDVLKKIKPLLSVNKKAGSHILTRLVAGHESTYPDGQIVNIQYVSDGAVIAAAIHAGFTYEKNGHHAAFNMSQKSIDILFDEKKKNEHTPLLKRIADCPVTQDDLEAVLGVFDRMKEEDRRDLTARSMQLIRLFDKERPFREVSDITLAVEFRLEALSRLMVHPEIKTFFPPSDKPGAVMISQPMLHIAATEPLLSKNDRPAFDVKSFCTRLSALPKEAYHGAA